MTAPTPSSAATPGLSARRIASDVFERTLAARLQLDDVVDRAIAADPAVEGRDAGLVRAITGAAFRHLGTITRALDARLAQGTRSLPRPVQAILVTGAAQILYLDAADHAAVDLAVALTAEQPQGPRFTGVVNAVLRKVAREADAIRTGSDPLAHDTPAWLAESWIASYGAETAARIARANRDEIALDLSIKADPAPWADRLDAVLLPTGSLRLRQRTPLTALPSYG